MRAAGRLSTASGLWHGKPQRVQLARCPGSRCPGSYRNSLAWLRCRPRDGRADDMCSASMDPPEARLLASREKSSDATAPATVWNALGTAKLALYVCMLGLRLGASAGSRLGDRSSYPRVTKLRVTDRQPCGRAGSPAGRSPAGLRPAGLPLGEEHLSLGRGYEQ
jgi:hypothetical protein